MLLEETLTGKKSGTVQCMLSEHDGNLVDYNWMWFDNILVNG